MKSLLATGKPPINLKFLIEGEEEISSLHLVEFIQKHNKETGPALIGIEVKSKEDFDSLIERMNTHKLNYTLVNQNENLFEYLV